MPGDAFPYRSVEAEVYAELGVPLEERVPELTTADVQLATDRLRESLSHIQVRDWRELERCQEGTEHQVDCSDGSAVDYALDGAELAAVERIQARALEDQAYRVTVATALQRLRRRAEWDGVVKDLLMVLGLG